MTRLYVTWLTPMWHDMAHSQDMRQKGELIDMSFACNDGTIVSYTCGGVAMDVYVLRV